MILENTLLMSPAGNPAIRPVHAGRSIEWLGKAFQIYLKTPLAWAVATLILAAGVALLSRAGPAWLSVSLIGGFGIVVLGKLMRACMALDEGRDRISLAQSEASLAPLWTLGLLAAAMCLLLCMVLGALGVTAAAFSLIHPAALVQVLGLNLLVIVAATVLMTMAMWLAPALVVLKGVSPLQAIKMSFVGTAKNFRPSLMYSALALLLALVALIPFFLGLLVAVPMFICGSYLAYRDIFTA
jgi:hypothetical protein